MFEGKEGALFEENLFGSSFVFHNYEALENMFEEIFIHKDYYFVSQKKDPVIIDCGSNIGLSILFFKKLYPQAQITGFEADPETFKLLDKNIKSARLGLINLVNSAVSNKEGTLDFFSSGAGETDNNMFKQRDNSIVHTVPAVMLSDYIDSEVDFLKIDIEGAENLLIENLAEKNKLVLIKELVMEYHHDMSNQTKSLADMLRVLEKNGFVYEISSSLRPPFSTLNCDQNFLIHAYRKGGQGI
jgi:FkbM family methyltransferase